LNKILDIIIPCYFEGDNIIDLLNTESKNRQKMLDEFNSIKKMLGDSGVFLRIADLIVKRT